MSALAERRVHDAIVVIEPAERRPWLRAVREVVSRRDLLYLLVIRDLKARYAQTVLGFGWAIIQPLAATGVFSIFFGGLANIPSNGVPYPVFALAALVPWTYFSNSITAGSASLTANRSLLTKVYLPRLVLPLASVIGNLVQLGIGIVVLVVVAALYGYYPTNVELLWLPGLVVLVVLAALAISVWLAPLAVQYRDVRYVTPFVVQLWLFATPIIYPLSIVPERYRPLLALNPMTGVVDGFRGAFVGGEIDLVAVAISAAVSITMLVVGVRYFLHLDRRFADVA